MMPMHSMDDMGGESVLGTAEQALVDAVLAGPIVDGLVDISGARSLPAEWSYLGSPSPLTRKKRSQSFVDPQLLESVTQGNASRPLKHTLSEQDLTLCTSRPPSGPSSARGCVTPPRPSSLAFMQGCAVTYPITPSRYIVGVIHCRNTPSPNSAPDAPETSPHLTPPQMRYSRVERHGRFTVIDLDDGLDDASPFRGPDLSMLTALQRRTCSAPESHACCDCA
jgi:hypothetical protein